MAGAYYNEIDKYAAAWLRELIKAGLIADGEVDERDIRDVSADDVREFRQRHWFAGIGGWSQALRLAGWPDDRAVWTGSCPCQPFSSAGAQAGGADPRDLWPAWFQLIRECRPAVVFGEQVESAIAHGWYDRVCDDLEGEGYAVGAAGLPACSVGAPHIRQRLWFVADCSSVGRQLGQDTGRSIAEGARQRCEGLSDIECGGGAGELADSNGVESRNGGLQRSGRALQSAKDAAAGELGYADLTRSQGRQRESEGAGERAAGPSGLASFWSDCAWLPCRDGKYRPVESGSFPLAHGVPARVGRLRGYGNAINPQVAAEFVKAYMDVRWAGHEERD